MDIAEILREARERAGLSQAALAIRAGTKQSTISRLEAGLEAPTIERVERILLVMGLRLVLEVEPLPSPLTAGDVATAHALGPEERLLESFAWNRFATAVEAAGAGR